MTNSKFKYQQPKNTEERIEAICEEIRSTSSSFEKKPLVSLKDYVVALLVHVKHVEWTRKAEREADDHTLGFALGTLGLVAILFLWQGWWGHTSDWGWLQTHQFAVRLWGIAFAAVFVGVCIERSSVFAGLWRFGFTKVIASVAVSALLVFSTGKASSLINALFGVDASAFPFTRAFVAGMLAVQYASPLLFVVALFLVFHAFDVAGYIQFKLKTSSEYVYTRPPWISIAFSGLATVILVVFWQWINHDFAEEALPTKIYRLAHTLDFNSRHSCANIKEGVSLVFVGTDQTKVLVDMSGVQTEDIESFVDPKLSVNLFIPKKFHFLSCNLRTQD